MSETKEQKKARIKKRNLLDFLVLQFARLNRRDEFFPSVAPPIAFMDDPDREEETVWSARTHMVRNRITDRRTMAKDRWNRFAGTESGGGRGL